MSYKASSSASCRLPHRPACHRPDRPVSPDRAGQPVPHISDDDLERYYLGLITEEEELAPIEEHLLWCEFCLDRMEVKEAFIDRLRIALMRANEETPRRASRRKPVIEMSSSPNEDESAETKLA